MEGILPVWWAKERLFGSQWQPFSSSLDGGDEALPTVAPAGELITLWKGRGRLLSVDKACDSEDSPPPLPDHHRISRHRKLRQTQYANIYRKSALLMTDEWRRASVVGGIKEGTEIPLDFMPLAVVRKAIVQDFSQANVRLSHGLRELPWPPEIAGNALSARSADRIIFSPTGAEGDVTSVRLTGMASWSDREGSDRARLSVDQCEKWTKKPIWVRDVMPSARLLGIETVPEHGGIECGDLLVSTRTAFRVSFYRAGSPTSADVMEKGPSLQFLSSAPVGQSGETIEDTCLSGWNPGELFVLLGDGTARLVFMDRLGGSEYNSSLIKLLPNEADIVRRDSWRVATYGEHVRQVLVTDRHAVRRINLEVGSFETVLNFSDWNLPTSETGFSAMQKHTARPFQIALATNHFICIADSRFMRTPVVTWSLAPHANPTTQLTTSTLAGLDVVVSLSASVSASVPEVSCMSYQTPSSSFPISPFPMPSFERSGGPLSHLPTPAHPAGIALIPYATHSRSLLLLQTATDGSLYAQLLRYGSGRRRETYREDGSSLGDPLETQSAAVQRAKKAAESKLQAQDRIRRLAPKEKSLLQRGMDDVKTSILEQLRTPEEFLKLPRTSHELEDFSRQNPFVQLKELEEYEVGDWGGVARTAADRRIFHKVDLFLEDDEKPEDDEHTEDNTKGVSALQIVREEWDR